jgi:hypothetical protein
MSFSILFNTTWPIGCIVHGCVNLSNYQLCSAAISNGVLPTLEWSSF